MSINVDTFRLLAPEYADKSDDEISAVGAIAEMQVDEDVWKSKYQLGLVYLSAHILKMGEMQNGAMGPVTSKKVGDLSINYGSITANESFDLTPYGVEFKRIRKQVSVSPLYI